MKTMRKRLPGLIAAAVLLAAPAAQAFDLEESLRAVAGGSGSGQQDLEATQSNGKTLSEAIEQVRRKTNGRIVSAETRVSGGREVHYIKVLTKDGKVKTHKVNGRKVGNR